MKLEAQIVNFKLSKKLKELNVRQDSLCYWSKDPDFDDPILSLEGVRFKHSDNTEYYSAFTVAELGEILFHSVRTVDGTKADFERLSELWEMIASSSLSEANGRAKILIYLIENKLIEPSKI
jgi:hypothetical protein